MGPRILTYKGNVEHIIGEHVISPRFKLGGGLTFVRWVATDATYYPQWDKTYVEWDVAPEVQAA